ncbi:MAG: hypothetical protein ACLSE4_13435 [Clostridium sp.]
MPNYTSDLLCPVIMDYNVDFPDMMGLFKKCFGELWKAGLEDIPGSISAQYYKKLPEDYYVLPYGMRDTLKKRREIMKKIEAFLDSIPRKKFTAQRQGECMVYRSLLWKLSDESISGNFGH